MGRGRAPAHAKRFALESPRLYAVTVVGVGICWLVVLGIIRDSSDLVLPFAEAFGYIAIGAGLWFLATGHTFAEDPKSLPSWWRSGFVVAVLLAGMAGFFLRQ